MRKKIIFIPALLMLLAIFFINSEERSRKAKNFFVRIDQIISSNFPNLETYVSVVSFDDKPILSLVPGNFKAFIDGEEIKTKLKVEGFHYTEDPIAYTAIVSVNGVMSGEPVAYQKKAVLNLYEQLRPQDVMSLYTFGEEVKPSFEFEKKNDKLLDKIDKTDILGFNPHLNDVLVQAARKINESKIKRKVLIIMTDGREVGSKYGKEQMFDIVDKLNIPVYSLGIRLMAGQNLHNINDISDHTGGGYIFSDQNYEIPDKMNLAIDQIKMGYYLKFKIGRVKGDNQLHQLEIRVNYKSDDSSFYKNFIATKVPLPLWLRIVILILVIILIAALVVLFLILRRNARKKIGITGRKCPACKRRMKDDWDECVFCKYLPPVIKKKKEKFE